MPINKSLMKELEKQYGNKKGESIYFGMENKGSKSFQKGVKTATKEGHTAKNIKEYKKANSKGGKK